MAEVEECCWVVVSVLKLRPSLYCERVPYMLFVFIVLTAISLHVHFVWSRDFHSPSLPPHKQDKSSVRVITLKMGKLSVDASIRLMT